MTNRHLLLCAALSLVGSACSTLPKPPELEAFERIKANRNYQAALKRAPELVSASQELFAKSTEEWRSKDLEESRRDALMGSIKLKTALALVEQDQARAKITQVNAELGKSEEEYGRLAKELAGLNEAVALMQKLQEARSSAASEKQRLAAQLGEEQLRAAARDKVAAAELALKTAETVEAASYAKEEYSSASDALARAQTELKGSSWSAAQTSADIAKAKAEHAFATAKPKYEQAQQSSSNKARDEALARDASSLSGITVRIERRGDVQRLILPLRNLFTKRLTTLVFGHEAIMDQVAALLKKYPTYPAMVIGHTDSKGKHDELVALSLARAQSVYAALVSRGIDAKRLSVSGQGPDEKIADNKSASGRAQNNRVEIVFLYQ